MLFTLGSRSQTGDVADLLIACHHRVREHLALARRLARAPISTVDESIRTSASRVRTYFQVAFPMHRADEEDDIFPLLLGRDDELDAAIAELMRDHVAHVACVDSVVEICTILESDPTQLHAQCARLADCVSTLEHELVSHLLLEERTVFPAISRMANHERTAIMERMRQRRAAAFER